MTQAPLLAGLWCPTSRFIGTLPVAVSRLAHAHAIWFRRLVA